MVPSEKIPMTKRASSSQPPASPAPVAASEAAARPSPGSLAALTALGVLSALWALFLWAELVLTRSGGTPFCALGGQLDCAAVWDSTFASTVHRLSGLPIAGWGLVWGAVALGLPLLALVRHAQNRAFPELVSAVRLTAAAGAVTVFVMIAVSLSERAFCLGCFVTYLLVAGYAGIALSGWKAFGLPEAGRGAGWAAALGAGAFALLLYPGLHTPRSGDEAGRAAVTAAAQRGPAASGDAGVSAPATSREPATAAAAEVGATRAVPPAAGGGRLHDFIASLPADQQQALSNALFIYRSSPPRTVPPPRALVGKPEAPVRITEFTDVLCSHCADLYETLHALQQQLPPGSFVIEPHQFPLDGECNKSVRMRGLPVRCVAAKALICLEAKPEAHTLAGVLFKRQRQLQPDMVYELASPYVPRAQLERCVNDPATQSKLDADVALGESYGITGTPLVLVNGRQGTPTAPFLYSMVLTRGSADDPAFDLLPPPNPMAGAHNHDH
jgi:serine/threonine-protein kinase